MDDGRGVRERRGEPAPVCDAAGGDDDDGRAGERARSPFADVDAGGDEDGEGDVAGVAAALAALGADDVGTCANTYL